MRNTTSLQSWLLLFACSAIWGSSFLLMKKGLIAFTPVQVASLRLFLASLFFLPIAISCVREIPKSKLWLILLVAMIGTGIPPFLFTIAQTVIDSATAGILNSLTPLFALIIGPLFFRMKMDRYKIVGVLTGFAGAVFIFWGRGFSNLTMNAYCLLVVLCTIFYALSSTMTKVYFQNIPPIKLTALILTGIGLPGGLIVLFSDVGTSFHNPHGIESFGYIIVLALVNTSFANFLFYKLIQRSTALFAQSVTYLMPVAAIILGFLDGEKILFLDFTGMGLILGGIYLINLKESY